jgi:sugar phosphate isomerase/epimerase
MPPEAPRRRESPSPKCLEDAGFSISLNELSLSRALSSGQLDHLDLARIAKTRFHVPAVEYASRFFREQVNDEKYLMEMNRRAADQDVRQLLIVVEGEGRLGDPDADVRKKAVGNHHRWVDAAEALGCHSIAVDAAIAGAPEEQLGRVAEAVHALCEYAERHHINVLVGDRIERPAGADWLLRVIRRVQHPACGALPSFACLAASKRDEDVVRLVGLAKGVGATSRDFDAAGRETHVDFFRIVSLVLGGGYRGYVGIAYQGDTLSETEEIRATKALLEAARSDAKPS